MSAIRNLPKKGAAFLFVVVILVASTDAAAQQTLQKNDEKLRSQVLSLLSGYEYVPRAGEWKELPEEAVSILVEVVENEQNQAYVRARAASALAHFPEEASTKALLNALKASQPKILWRSAVKALGFFPSARSAEAVAEVLEENDVTMREAAVQSLSRMNLKEARDPLNVAASKEKIIWLKKRMEAALQKLPAPKESP